MKDRLFSTSHVAKKLGVSVRTIHRLAATCQRGERIGGALVFTLTDMKAMQKVRRQQKRERKK